MLRWKKCHNCQLDINHTTWIHFDHYLCPTCAETEYHCLMAELEEMSKQIAEGETNENSH